MRLTKLLSLLLLIITLFLFTSCGEKETEQEVNYVKANRCLSASEVIEESLHSPNVSTSYYDDNNYYYVIYLGRIKDFIISNYLTFEYTKEREILGDYNLELTETTESTVTRTYKTTLTTSTATTFDISTSTTVSAKVKTAFKGLNAEAAKNITKKCEETWTNEVSETKENFYSEITRISNSKITNFKINYEKCLEGLWYCYATVADVDVYLGVEYNPETTELCYDYYSNIASNVGEKVFISDRNDFQQTSGTFDFDLSFLNDLNKPEQYISNHPTVTMKIAASESTYVVKAASSGKNVVSIKTNLNGYSAAETSFYNLDEYINKGYGYVKVTYSFIYTKKGDAMLHVNLGLADGVKNPNFERNNETEGTYTITGYFKVSELADFGAVYIIFNNQNFLFDYSVSNIVCTVDYLYKL